MANKMLIDASHVEKTYFVVLRDNLVEELDFESEHKKQIKMCIERKQRKE